MRKISDVVCDLIFANWEIHCVEHVKMEEFDKGCTMDHGIVTAMDKIMRIQSEKRKAYFNELNDVFKSIVHDKRYDYASYDKEDK